MRRLDLPKRLPAVKRSSVADGVAELLREQLLSGEFAPGTVLQEIPLANALRVSRNTLREAVRNLVAEGLLAKNLHKGVAVAALRVADAEEVFAVREIIEGVAIERACQNPQAFVPRLNDLLEQLQKAVAGKVERQIVAADLAFHEVLVSALGSPRLQHFYAVLVAELRLALAVLDRRGQKHSVTRIIRHHQQILSAIRSGNAGRARKMLLAHLRDSRDRLVALLCEADDVLSGAGH